MAEIKVTDKRMFTPDGNLREESAPEPEATREAPAAAEAGDSATPPTPPAPPTPERPRVDLPGAASGPGAPTFFDLLTVLAEPVSLYLGDLELPGGESAENLELARLHIDLLDLLRQRTIGNLSAQELAVLDDLLYRVRMRYLEKRG